MRASGCFRAEGWLGSAQPADDQAGKLRATANDTYQVKSTPTTLLQASDKVSQIVDRGKEAYDRARGSVSNIAGSVSSHLTHAGNGDDGADELRRPGR